MKGQKDISSRKDIELFIRSFYEKVIADETIGIVFTKIVKMDWDHHIPLITDFWESILLDNPVYKNNAMEVHYHINKLFPLQKIHFDAWLHLFNATLCEMYQGPVADMALKRAAGIAGLMEFKMKQSL